MELELVPATGSDRVAAVLDALIERELILAEVERYVPPEPAPELVQQRIGSVRAGFQTDEAFARSLARNGMTEQRLRDFVRDDLRIVTYLAQRFGATEQVTEQDVEDYYNDHAEDFRRGGDPLPFAAVRDQIRQRLLAERRQTLIGQWIAGLRRRAEIISLYVPGRL